MTRIEGGSGHTSKDASVAKKWVDQNASDLQRDLLQYRTRLYTHIARVEGMRSGFDWDYIDPLFRTHSEMGVCRFWGELALPLCFSVVHGSVKILDQQLWNTTSTDLSNHTYVKSYCDTQSFASSNPVILDHCVSQFVNGAKFRPGERLDRVRAQAPELFQSFKTPYGDLTVLIGNQDEIQSKLGIQYFHHPVSRR